MKKIELKKYVTCIICIVMFGCILTSCENDQDLSLSNQINDSKLFEQKNAIQSRRSVFNNCGIQIKPGEVQPFPGEPVHGLPNQTIYKFFVGNPSSDVIKVEVMFSAPDGNTYYDYMQKNSSGNWFLEKKLIQSGHYTVKYSLYKNSGNKETKNPTPNYVDNTKVYLSGGRLHMIWPFGYEDGTTWNDKGNWRITCGPGCGHHVGEFSEAQDWAKPGCKGKKILSPVDGIITTKTLYNGGKLLGITQKIGTVNYVFAVNHLDEFASGIKKGTYVKAGETILGTIGETGVAYGPHAHTQVKVNGKTIPIDFSAK